ncbi:MAG: low affinity iron permease family protein [Bacteroidia bacterium]|nr:low affinity iron permease family protein [Bacteroidia bacterium]
MYLAAAFFIVLSFSISGSLMPYIFFMMAWQLVRNTSTTVREMSFFIGWV